MTKTSAHVVHASICEGEKIATVAGVLPRCVLAELNTHRVFSRNAQSSRAVPINRMIKSVMQSPYIPEFLAEQKGMQGGDPIGEKAVYDEWLKARDEAVMRAVRLSNMGVHKQAVNRLLEPFSYVAVAITSAHWDNFFDLRCDAAADPAIRNFAVAVRDALDGAEYVERPIHSPYNDDPMQSAAIMARISYLTRDPEKKSPEENIALAKRLAESKHMSPFEHQAVHASIIPLTYEAEDSRNFAPTGWAQHRAQIEREHAKR